MILLLSPVHTKLLTLLLVSLFSYGPSSSLASQEFNCQEQLDYQFNHLYDVLSSVDLSSRNPEFSSKPDDLASPFSLSLLFM